VSPGAPAGDATPGLSVSELTVQFGGVKALTDVSFDVQGSEVHGLVGPNGSGKTTILNAVCGFIPAQGEVQVGGTRIERLASHRRMAMGLGRTFQNPRSSQGLTVRDLMRIGEHLRSVQPWWQVALVPRAADRALAASNERGAELLEMLGLPGRLLDEHVSRLPSGVLKIVDIARALMGTPRVLLLDEPTSGMNDAEIDVLHSALKHLRRSDVTIVLVEHNLRFMFDICDSMTVLNTGAVVARGAPAEVFAREDVIRAYMGEKQRPLAAESMAKGS
jgi:ABC-type branched-subunit amino acid transport system ATPase component